MSKTLSAFRAVIRQILRDEAVTDLAWEDDELDLHISECLAEISTYSPYQVKETLYIVAKSGTATLTTTSHLIDTTKNQFVAGDVGKTVYNTTDTTTAKITVVNSSSDVTLDTNIMALGEGYEIYCADGTNSKDLNISSITDLLNVDWVEYKTRQTPADKRNHNIFGDILTIDTTLTPTNGEEVFIYCNKLHSLTESASTLKPQLERVLVLGVCGNAAISKAQSHINQINKGGAGTVSELQNWGLAKLALYRIELGRLAKPKTYRTYSES